MSSFVVVCRAENSKEECIELPTEDDGSLLLSVLQSQFEGASGLKYRNPVSGSWRAIKLSDGQLKTPSTAGWGELTYYVVMGNSGKESSDTSASVDYLAAKPAMSVGYSNDGTKRIKLEEQPIAPVGTTPQPTQPYMYGGHMQQHATPSNDLIVLGLEWTVTTEDLKLYFEKFGEITSAEVKTHPTSGSSRGFGFIRFKDPAVYQKVCELNHAIKGRKVEVKLPNSHPAKLFVGCLPLKPPVEKEELEKHFSEFGTLTDVYVPHEPYRGFAFITFRDPAVAQRVMSMQHVLRKSQLNLSLADPKGGAKAATHHHTAYTPQNYTYQQQQQQYGQYSQYAQHQGHPQATAAAAYGYNPYGTSQARANYNRGFMDSRALQFSQDQTHRPMLTQNATRSNPAYTHQQHYPQQQDANPGTQATTSLSAGAGRGSTQPSYDLKGVWSNY